MKDTYEKPVAEKIVFSYQEQVVAASGMSGSCTWNANLEYDTCDKKWINNGN